MKIPGSLGRVAVAAGAVLVLGGSAVGIAAAQQSQPTSTPTAYQKFIDSLAQRLGISSQQLQTDISQARQDAGLPQNGGFPGGPGGRGPRAFGFAPGANLQVAAQAIGITAQQLRTELPGKSLAQVAQNHGKSGTDVANALKNEANQQIDTRIDELVNRTIPQNANLGQGAQPSAQNGAAPNGNGNGNANRRGPRGFAPGLVQQGLDTAAQAIGITTDQLRTELPGKSLAQVAQNHGKNASDVSTALKNAAHQQIDSRIDQSVNQVVPQRGPRPGRQGGDQQQQTS
jgi:transposase-like protein